MATHTLKYLRKLSATTAAAALMVGVSATSTAGAQELSSAGQFSQLSSVLFGGKDEQAPAPASLLVDLPQGAAPLTATEAIAAFASPQQAKKHDRIALHFHPGPGADGTFTFHDGCNRGSGKYIVDSSNALHVSDTAQTLIGCDPEATARADEFSTILNSKPMVFRIDDTTIALASQGKAIEFVPAPEAPNGI